jgi:probable HAF family extracellular repeat protein
MKFLETTSAPGEIRNRWLALFRFVFALSATLLPVTFTSAQAPPQVPQGNYTITDLGVLGSLQDTDSEAVAINNNGTVVGYSGVFYCEVDSPFTTCTLEHGFDIGFLNEDAFVWTPTTPNGTTGTMIHPNPLPGNFCTTPQTTDPYTGGTDGGFAGNFDTHVFDVNSSGKAAGDSFKSDSNCNHGQYDGVIYFNGVAQDLGTPPGYTETGNVLSNPSSTAYGINDAGVAVGYTIGDGGNWLGWIYDGSYHLLGNVTAGIYQSTYNTPNKINNNGVVVGCTDLGGYIHQGTGTLQNSDLIGPLSGGTISCPYWINDAGGVVGQSDVTTADGFYTYHAFYRDPKFGSMKDLGTLSSDPLSESLATGINNSAHDVVGYSDVDLSKNPAWVWSQHATIWESGGPPTDLNLLVDPKQAVSANCPTCWELTSANGINDLGQIVGEGIYNGDRHAFLLTPKCINDGGDSDGDGLCDNWEKYGYTDPKSGEFVNLPKMGAHWDHKDIFVQADYMVDSTIEICTPPYVCSYAHTHEPNPDAMAMVIKAFANAPVENPDGLTGINIHIDCGRDCIMDPETGDTWGDFSLAQAIDPEITLLGDQLDDTCIPIKAGDCAYDWSEFEGLRDANFVPTGRAASFHYMIFGHSIAVFATLQKPDGSKGVGLANATGIGDIPDSNFIVALGAESGQVGKPLEQAGSFMHELGHNLGLRHGGVDNINAKPNYLSVMNYSFQFGLITNGVRNTIDYSEFYQIPDLDEHALNEQVGLDGGPLTANYGTFYYCYVEVPVTGGTILQQQTRFVPYANSPIDWNCNGAIDPKTLTDGFDIDGLTDQLNDPQLTTAPLATSQDWSHLIFTGGAIGQLGLGSSGSLLGQQAAEGPVPNLPVPNDVDVVSPGLALVLPGASLANFTFTITNTGQQPDTYNLTPVSQYTWWDTSGVPASVTLAAGASQQITIPVTVPTSFGCSNANTIRATFILRATSQTYPSLSESGAAELDLVPTAGTVTLPSVVGLTQSAAEAAITSAGLSVGAVTTQASTTVPSGTVVSQAPAACALESSASSISIVVSSGPPQTMVPNVVGLTQAAAIAAMNAAGLNLGSEPVAVSSSTVPVGDVVSQNPPAGTKVTPNTFFSLTIASTAPGYVVTPNLSGPISNAIIAINAAGLNLGLITQAVSIAIPDGTVISQVPPAGSPTGPGSYVNLTVSYNYDLQGIPNIVGDTQAAAISAILSAGFSIGSIGESASNTAAVGTVILQSPLPGAVLSPTTPVSFSLSTGPVGPQSFIVPDVYGLTQSEASSAITTAGLTVGTVTQAQQLSMPVGDVFSQTPQPGSYAASGSAVNLQVSAAAPQYTVPDFLTKSTYYTTALMDITAAGLIPGVFTAQSATVPPGYVISQNPAAGTVVAGGSGVNVTYSLGDIFTYLTVPSVVGENQVFATNSIEPGFSGLYVSVTRQPSTTVPDGFVISQNPAANSQAPDLTLINLVVSSGGPVAAAVPNIVGTNISGISTTGAFPAGSTEPTLNAAGFAVGSVTYQPSASIPFGQVISQNPPAGTKAAWDTSVSFVYSSGPPVSITMPNIVGQTQGAAISALSLVPLYWTLTTQSSQTVPSGVVISQNPPAGTSLQGAIPGTVEPTANVSVSFVVSAGPNAVPSYSLLTQFGDYGAAFAGNGQFYASQSLAIDPRNGNILVGDQTGRIQVFDHNGNFQRYFGGNGVPFVTAAVPGTNQLTTLYPNGTGGGLFADGSVPASGGIQGYPSGLAVDPVNGNVVALDVADRVLIFNSAGVLQSTFGSPGQGPGQFSLHNLGAGGVAVDPVTENILVTDWGNTRVQIFSSTGAYLGQFGTQGSGNGQFGFGLVGIAVDPDTRNIVVMDSGNSRVQIFNSSGEYLSQFGPPVKAAGASWSYPPCSCEGLAIDAVTHNIIVQGAISGTPQSPAIQIFDAKGNYLSQFGGFGTSYGGGLAVDPASHHIVTIGLAGVFVGNVQIFGAPIAAAATSTALTSSLNPANPGQSVTFTATVSGSGPTGNVQFYYGDTPLGAPVVLLSGTASYSTSTLPIGTDSIIAIYSGDGNNASSSSAVLNEVISSNPATVRVASSLNPAIAGQPITFTATVIGNNPTGTVEFLNGTNSLSAAVALSGGGASFTTSSLPVGADSITAVYSGDANNATSTSGALSQVITLAATRTGLISSGNHVTLGQPVTFTATVAGNAPTGSVQFFDGNTSLGTVSLPLGNVAALAISSLAVGTHSITAVYSGDKFNSTSTSAVLNELISLNGATTISLAASANPVTAGLPVSFTATVKGTGIPIGTVQFMDGATGLGSPVTLTAGTATLTTSALAVGAHSIVAVYNGDASNAAGDSATLSEVVSLNITNTSVTSSTNPATLGQAITFTANVKGSNPSGPIVFLDGATPLVTLPTTTNVLGKVKVAGTPPEPISVSLTNGQASITVSNLAAGTHSITAVYRGDPLNTGSTSAILSEVIQSGAAPPVVMPPANISIPATQAQGATSSASSALAAFLAGATATSTLPTAPVQLAPQVGGLAVTGSTLFPIGTTTVTFSFKDSNGNIGSATSRVTVAVGIPRITGTTAGIGSDPSGAIYVNVVLTNTGTGNAQNLQINTLTIRTLSGTGMVIYNATLSPPLPHMLGSLSVGTSITTKIYLNVPNTVTRISITESGPVQDVTGTNYNYSAAEGVVP